MVTVPEDFEGFKAFLEKYLPIPLKEEDWRPKQMNGHRMNGGYPYCGCYMHHGANFQEWIFCELHAAVEYPVTPEQIFYYSDPNSRGCRKCYKWACDHDECHTDDNCDNY